MSDAPVITVALPTLGCKVNRYDSDTLARALMARGYRIVPPGTPADVVIVNTCTVTRGADAKSRKLVRKALRAREDAVVIATGCYATLAPDALLAVGGVNAVVPHAARATIPDLVVRLRPPTVGRGPADGSTAASVARTRATVKVQDGCDLSCAYCAVTMARGALCSRPLEDILVELRQLAASGITEIVLTGIRLDAYGRDLGLQLADLLDATRDLAVPRLRLSSLEPIGLDARLIAALAAHPALCHHFHLCLQSGDDAVLRAMRRGYTAAGYLALIGQMRAAMPDATFTTDVIVGFPGETETAFAHTQALLEAVGFLDLHVFPYSARPGTAAAVMDGQVPDAVKTARAEELLTLTRTLFARHAATRVGSTVSVLVERTGTPGNGLTAHYERVCAPFAPQQARTIAAVTVTGYTEQALFGVAEGATPS